MKTLPCIGLVGYIGSGKNTVCNIIRGMGYEIEELSFAYSLREKAVGIFNIDFESTLTDEGKQTIVDVIIPTRSELVCFDMNDSTIDIFYHVFSPYIDKKTNLYKISIRTILQLLGTEVYRSQDLNYWVNQIALKENSIITDTRFPNEAKYIKESGGILVKVTNLNKTQNDTTHLSEKFIDSIECDHEILNDGKSFDNLSFQVVKLIAEL